ncbi:MFS family permease [Sphingomonas jejuensis]|uniref:MFS family permease n=1 Tax=Sphingomonas jejuensis TaxID=904715 RepID=A0ABX0XK09_9SPHN|nr:MFS transporter [Sphingomonas jejuensis]NJC33686.1 MFS family permease [Sphingomonas jejuensis]
MVDGGGARMTGEAGEAPLRSSRFIVGYGLANAGAFIAFIPLLTLLLPSKAAEIDPAGRALLLSQIGLASGLTAALANLLFGAASDATRTRFGRRRPWILGGLAATILSLLLIGWAPSPAMLLGAMILYQVSVNAMFAPLLAVLPDMVPDRQKGTAAAWAGLALPAGYFFTAGVVGVLVDGTATRFTVVCLAVAALVLPFALRLREPRVAVTPAGPRLGFAAFRFPDFRAAFLSRFLLETGVTLNMLYLLFYLGERTDVAAALPTWSVDAVFSLLLGASTAAGLASGFLGGLLSDRIRRRKPLVVAGGLLMCAGISTTLLAPDWPGPLVGQVLFGTGHGLYATTTIALIALVLPDPARTGRDLGAMNLSVALSQSFGPLVGITLFAAGGALPSVYIAGTLFAALGTAMLLTIRGVR